MNYEAVPLSPFLINPLNPSHVRGACNGAKALHAVYDKKLKQILKFIIKRITLLNLVAK